MRRIGRNVDRLAGSRDRLPSSEDKLDFAFQDREHLLEIVAMRRRTATRRDIYINETMATGSVVATDQDCIGVTHNRNVRQFVFVRSSHCEFSSQIVSRNCRDGFGGDG